MGSCKCWILPRERSGKIHYFVSVFAVDDIDFGLMFFPVRLCVIYFWEIILEGINLFIWKLHDSSAFIFRRIFYIWHLSLSFWCLGSDYSLGKNFVVGNISRAKVAFLSRFCSCRIETVNDEKLCFNNFSSKWFWCQSLFQLSLIKNFNSLN